MAGDKVGGAETFFVDLVIALRRAGLPQRVVIRHNENRATLLREAGLEPVELPFGRHFDFATRRGLARAIEEFRPDVVQTWMSRASAVPLSGDFIHVGWTGGYLDLKYYRKCDALIGVTQDLVDNAVHHGWSRGRVHCLPTFAADEPLPPLPREEFGTPESAPLVLGLGRLHRDKGFDVLLRALADIPEAYLWLAGEGPYEGALKQLTAELGLENRVRFLGWRSDRAALYAACDMCVMPTRIEGFGTVMIEAWAYHRPVVATAAKGPCGLIKHGENGLLVAIDDIAALAASMRTLIEDPGFAKSLAQAGRAAYEAQFTEAAVVERYLAFYDGL